MSKDKIKDIYDGEIISIWGDKELPQALNKLQRGYKWHLQQAVISDDPLQYYWMNKP